jgi:hypothetical protein
MVNAFKEYLKENKSDVIKIGFVGFSSAKFDETKAKEIIKEAFDTFIKNKKVEIVSGLTNLGIPKLVYKEAKKRELYTVGIACEKAKEYDCFDCDKVIIVGKEWGDESEDFLNYIDVLIKIGGGKQSVKEFKKAKEIGIKTKEYELEEIK